MGLSSVKLRGSSQLLIMNPKNTPRAPQKAMAAKTVYWWAVAVAGLIGLGLLWAITQQKNDSFHQLEQQRLESLGMEFGLQLERKSNDYVGYILSLREQLLANPQLEQNQLIRQTLAKTKFNLDFSSVRNIRVVHSGRCNRDTQLPLIDNDLHFQPIVVQKNHDVFTLETYLGAICQNNFDRGIAMDIALPDLFKEVMLTAGLRGIAYRVRAVDGTPSPYEPFRTDSNIYMQAGEQSLAFVLRTAVFGRSLEFVFTPTEPLVEQTSPWFAYLGVIAAFLLFLGFATRFKRRMARQDQEHQAVAAKLDRALLRRDLLQHFSREALLVVDVQSGRVVEASDFYASLLGYSEQELRRLYFPSLIKDSDIELADLQLSTAAAVTASEPTEVSRVFSKKVRHVHKSGNTVEVELFGIRDWPVNWYTPVVDPSVQTCLLIAHDLSTQIRLESELERTHERHRYMLEHLPMGVCTVGSGWDVDSMNQQFRSISGLDEYTQLRHFDAWWQAVVTDRQSREVFAARWAQLCAAAQVGSGEMEPMEFSSVLANGETKTFEMSGMAHDSGFVFTLVDTSHHKKAEDEIRNLAFYDSLTGLPNGKLLLDRLEQAMMTGAKHHWYSAVLSIDLDGFKAFNDSAGYGCGDELLRAVAKRLRGCVPQEFTMARIAGDQFVVVMTALSENPSEAANLCKQLSHQIMSSMREVFDVGDKPYRASVCIGAAVFKGRETYPREMLRRADIALEQAKHSGENALQFFDPAMQAHAKARAALESDIRAGMALGQFVLYFQPQLEGGNVIGAEALLRWRNGDDGFVSPTAFISTAEESNLILPLGNWVLQQACKQLSVWAVHPATKNLTLSVNVSPRQFKQAGFVQQLIAALASTAAPASQLKLEITEGVLLENVELAIQTMNEIRSYGVRFSLDDFGTGYSSLSHLQRLPISEIKIDRSFVRNVTTNPNDASIVRTITSLGKNLGLVVVAEGVETREQRDFLLHNGCNFWQGYLAGKPQPLSDFERLLSTHPRAWD